jgi:hypothetical protein
MRSKALVSTVVALGVLLASGTASHAAAPVIAITTANVNVRQSPGGDAIGTLPPGTTVGVLGFQSPWVQVVYIQPQIAKGQHGWIHVQYLRLMGNQRGGRVASVSGDNCESESDTGAQVCVRLSDTDIGCSKSFAGEYYSSCSVSVEYEVETDYDGDDYIEAEVSCEVEISYRGQQIYAARSDSDSQEQSHDLYASDSESNSMEFEFSFSSFNEVTSARIESAQCQVTSVTAY